MPEHVTAPVVGLELTILLLGVGLWWRLALSPHARANRHPAVLVPWDAAMSEFLLFLWMIFCGAIVGEFLASSLFSLVRLDEAGKIILGTALFDLGMLAGIAFFRSRYARATPAPAAAQSGNVFLSGTATMLAAMPLVYAVGAAWQYALQLCGLPVEAQDIVARFAQAKSPGFLLVMTVVATVLAPIAEELIFRAGIFRYLRTRLPRWAALLVPACLFAALHQSLANFAQLAALGIVFSLAYERTGRIGTSIVAHGLFNLHSIVLILLGVTA